MSLAAEKFTIELPRPFRIAHGSSSTRDTILVHLHDEETGLTGHGEGALPPYYPSTADACLDWIGRQQEDIPTAASETTIAARVALEIAHQDLHAQRLGKPLWELFAIDFKAPPCARTLSIPLDERELVEGLREGAARGSTVFKLKLGSGDIAWDEECVAIARRTLPQARFSVDVNAGWEPGIAAQLIPRLTVDFVEQPVAKDWEAWRELRGELAGRSHPPLVADESIQSSDDIDRAVGLADGVNVKLLKAGGLSGAVQWITATRRAGLRVMIGVMVETGIGRTAAAHLAPLADWLDIDPPDMIPVKPLCGFSVEGDHLLISRRPGLGLRDPASLAA